MFFVDVDVRGAERKKPTVHKRRALGQELLGLERELGRERPVTWAEKGLHGGLARR